MDPTLSSTSSSSHKWTFGVFLSFRGEDTRDGFTGYLYDALREKGIHTFIDDRLNRGEEITPGLFEAIEKSRIAVVILSVNYASSTFCLEELVKILECREQKGQLVLPIFYKVDPSDVRHIRESYGDALAKHEAKFKNEEEKVQKWKSVLGQVVGLSGFHFKEGDGPEYEFVKKIVGDVSKRINHTSLYVAKYPVGLESRRGDVISLLDLGCDKEVLMVGIHGIGGVGKTTITFEVHNEIFHQFEDVCFLSVVRETSNKYGSNNQGLVELQQTLLLKLTKEKEMISNVNEGILIISKRLCQKKVLLILDDVDSKKQLEALAGAVDWFGVGSRIIITTRDKHLLDVHGVHKYYNVNELCPIEALELFSWNAFKKKEVDSMYESISNRMVDYCKGLPLALEIIGSNLFGKTQEEWKSALDTYEKIPDEDIQKILKVSYDGLQERQKEIFLDIACFFKGNQPDYVKNILEILHGYDPKYHIGVLMEKSLIKWWFQVQIHDLIVQMGKEIVRHEASSNPGSRSRLWCYNDIRRVLEEDEGTDKIEILKLNMPHEEEVLWNGKAFKKMKNLKMLEIESARFSCEPKYLPNSLRVLKWKKYPSSSLPSEFHPRNLTILELEESSFRSIKPFKNWEPLTKMNLSGNHFLKQVPDVSGALNLRELNIRSCENLIEVHSSVGFLDKLVKLDAYGCTELRKFPRSIKSASLKLLDLSKCFNLQNVPQLTTNWRAEFDYLSCTGLHRFQHISYGQLAVSPSKGELLLTCCTSMLKILDKWKGEFHGFSSDGDNQERANPKVLVNLRVEDRSEQTNKHFSVWPSYYSSLTDLTLEYCNLTDDFLHWLPRFLLLKDLNVKGNEFTILPECMNECRCLETLVLDYCSDLREIEGVPPKVKYLSTIDCVSLTSQSSSKLLSQEFHAKEVNVPGSMIPAWLDHRCTESSISFWYRKKIPRLVVCCMHNFANFSPDIDILVNGIRSSAGMTDVIEGHTTCISLIDADKGIMRWDKEKSRKIELKGNEWNHVEVSVRRKRKDYIYMMGVHVYKEEIGSDNIRFIDPNPLKRTDTVGDNLDLNTLSKEFCPFLGMQVCDTIDSRKKDEHNHHCVDLDGSCLLVPKGAGNIISWAIWSMEAPRIVKVLLWKITHFSMPTCNMLYFKGFLNDPLCPICQTKVETIEHVFLECPWTRPIWFGSDFGWILEDKQILEHKRNYGSSIFMEVWLTDRYKDIEILHPNHARRVSGLMGNIIWTIWEGRNEFVLSCKPVDPWKALRTAKAMHKRYCSIFPTGTDARSSDQDFLPAVPSFLQVEQFPVLLSWVPDQSA